MFSRKTLHIAPRRFIPAIILTAAFILLAELAFRGANLFDDHNGWESPGLQQKMKGARDLFRQTGRIDLFVLSTSVGRVLDVRQWEEACQGQITGYNMGFPDQRPERQYFLFKRHLFPQYHPTHLIYGVAIPDTNSNVRGMHPDRPKEGPFWEYRNIRQLRAKTLLEESIASLDAASELFRSRQRARFTLQYGEIAELPEDPTIGRGVIVPTLRRQPFGPMPTSWALDPLGMPYNSYHKYWAPENGEFGQILKLARFCEENGVKFAVVEIPTSPYAHTNFDNPKSDYQLFTAALDRLAQQGVRVHPMARDLQLGNTYFEDQEHLNRWGAQLVTDYVYQHVIRDWFPEKTIAPDLPKIEEISLAEAAEETDSAIAIRPTSPATPDAQFAAMSQVIVTEPVNIPLRQQITPGPYAIEIYAGDGSTTSPVLTGEAALSLKAIRGTDILAELPLEWINSRAGIAYTQAWLEVPSTSTLSLSVERIGHRPVILDTAFIRSRFWHVENQVIVE